MTTTPFPGPSENATSPSVGGGSSEVPVVVVDADQAARSRLAMQLGQGATPFASVEDLVLHLTGSPVVMVLGPSYQEPAALAVIERLLFEHREAGAILVTTELTTDLLQQALRVGVKDVLAAPVDTGQLLDGVRRVADTLSSATPVLPESGGVEALPTDGAPGRVITVFSTKGGAGKSVIASNLAVLLAQRSERPVCLVDADLQFGDIAVMLKLSPQHTIVDAVSALDRLDPPMMQSLLVQHEASGLFVLPAPLEPAFADQIGAGEMVHIVEVLRSFCEYVVLDTPAYFNDVVLGLIEVSDDVLLVAGMDIPNIKNVKIGLQTLRLLNTPMEKLRLILNRANSKVKLDVGEVERTLQVQADALIPSDVVVPQAVNKGVPVVLSAPKSSVAKSLEQLVELFAPTASASKKKKR